MNKSTPMSILNNLMLRNEDAAQKYREAAALIEDDSLVGWLEGLAGYRQDLADELRRMIQDMPPSPMAMNVGGRSYLGEHWDEFREVLLLNNRKKIASFCHQSEKAASEYYKESLSENDLIEQFEVFIEEQHKTIVKVLRKTERMDTVPMQKNGQFKDL